MVNTLSRDELELKKLRSKRRQKTVKFYFLYLFAILCLAYIVDELATNIMTIMQKEVLNAFFGGESGLNNYTFVMTLCSGVSILTFVYKSFADKVGRRPLLIADVIGMAAGMFICSFSTALPMYIIGIVIIYFFIPADLQVIYVLESSSDKNRGLFVALSKAIGVMGLSLVPLFRQFANTTTWQFVFLFPAIIGLIAAVLTIIFVKETPAYYNQRIKYLTNKIKEKEHPELKEESKADKAANAQGGLIAAVKFMFYQKKFLWLFLVIAIFSMCYIGAANFSIILQPESGGGLSAAEMDQALLIYPFSYAVIQVINGVISDRKGRKVAVVISGTFTFISIMAFVIGVKSQWDPYIIGMFLGWFLGGYYASVDTFNIITSETVPTNLRSSLLSVIGMAGSVGQFASTGILLLFKAIKPDLDIGYFSLLLIAPSLFIALLVLFSKIEETKNRSLS